MPHTRPIPTYEVPSWQAQMPSASRAAAVSGDGWQYEREERRAAMYAQEHQPHTHDCTCGCRYEPGDV